MRIVLVRDVCQTAVDIWLQPGGHLLPDAVLARGSLKTHGSPWLSLEGSWEFHHERIVSVNKDGTKVYEVEWLPIWIFEKGIQKMGPRAQESFRRLQAHYPEIPSQDPTDPDDRWTQAPISYRCHWDGDFTKLRKVDGQTQGLAYFEPSKVQWDDLTEWTRRELLKG